MKRRYIFLIFIFPLLHLSCSRENMCDCLKSTGDIETEVRNINGYNNISVEDNINLYITEDSTFSLAIEAGSNLMSLIKTEVMDNCLYLKNDNKCNWVRNYKDKINVYLKCPKINSIVYKGSGDITTTDTIHALNFQLDDWNGTGTIDLTLVCQWTTLNLHTGPADLNLKGTSETTYLYSAGNGKADLQNYFSDYCYVSNKSTNNCWVNATKELDVKIFSIGDIYYTGTFYFLKTEISGSGQLIPF